MYLYFGNVNFMIKLKTPQQIADKANEIDYRLTHKEPKSSFVFKLKSFLLKLRF